MGPTKNKCGGCSKPVSGKSVQCACCNLWYHTTCADIEDDLYNNILATHKACGMHVWACKACSSSIRSLNTRVIAMETQMKKIEEIATTNKENIEEVEERMGTIESQVQTLTESSNLSEHSDATKDDIFKELSDRETRKANIIIYGLKESTSPISETRKTHDRAELDKVLEILKPANFKEEDIKFMHRTGERDKNQDSSDPRPLLIGFRNSDTPAKVLSNCWKLNKSVYKVISISPDLTKRQRKEDKDTREECSRLNRELTREEQLNWTWKVIGQKGQKKLVKVRVRGGEQGTGRRGKRSRTPEETSPGPQRKH